MGRDRDGERIDRLFQAIGALEATAAALERSKTDKADAAALGARFQALDTSKADRAELIALRDDILKRLQAEIADLSERLGDRLNTINSRFLAVEATLKNMSESDKTRGARLAGLSETVTDLAKILQDDIAAREAEKRNRWKRWRGRFHYAAQYSFQAFAGVAFAVILVREGFPGIPQALTYLRAFLGIGF